ncbi:uncharacterized protein BDV14DRAFT_204123 [Aspergillus stella-maris]|uniref:uncharacterized protein n=1 Tax=Aspergillus stella-maris TaxID=1810926 RepID=UPI003CCCDB92
MPNTKTNTNIKNPYKKHAGSSGGTGIAAAAAGSDIVFQNPGDAVQNGLKAWSMHRFMEANEARASKNAQQMSTGQVEAGSLKWGENGITAEIGYVRDKDGGIRYVGKK